MNETKIINPILPGFNPDPSILRVDQDFIRHQKYADFDWFRYKEV